MKTKLKHSLALVMSFVMLITVVLPMSSIAQINIDGNILTDIGSGMMVTSKTNYVVAPGISELQVTTNNSSGTNQSEGYAIEVDLSVPSTSILASYKNYSYSSLGMQTVRDQAVAAESFYQKTDSNFDVVAGINGDFFNMTTGAPTGTFVMSGSIYNTNTNWPYFAILKDGTAEIGRKASADKIATFKESVGGPCVIVENGKITSDAITSDYGVDQLPRSAVGIKADGAVVLLTVDGRQAPKSCGMTFKQLAETMIAMGCVDGLSLDGGGSATLLSQHEGSNDFVCRNSPSDGAERTVSSSILVCSNAAPDGEFDHATISPNNEIYTPGSSVKFEALGVDSSGSAVTLPADGVLTLADSSFGTIENGVFTSTGKTGTVQVDYMIDGLSKGSTTIEIQNPDQISFTNSEISLGFEKTTNLGLEVKYKTLDINYKEGDIIWAISDPTMGSFTGNMFTSSDSATVTGKITATSAFDSEVKGELTAIIGKLPSIVWDFEDTDKYIFAHATCDSGGGAVNWYDSDYVPGVTTMLALTYGKGGASANCDIVDQDNGQVRFDSHALKLSYDFTGVKGVTEGACAGSVEATKTMEGTPTAIGMWVYAPEGTPNFWLRMRFKDGNNSVQTVNFTKTLEAAGDGVGGINWTGWKYVEADLTSFKGPFSMIAGESIRLMYVPPTKNGLYTITGGTTGAFNTIKDADGNDVKVAILNSKAVNQADCKGYIYIDNVQFVYGANNDDVDNPVIDTVQVGNDVGDNMTNIGTATVVDSNKICIQSTFHDIINKNSTGINFDSIRIYVDGKMVETDDNNNFVILKGDFTVKYYTTLANGTHAVKIVVRDGFNNETSETRYFAVDGSENLPTVKVEPASDTCILNTDYAINILANEVDSLTSVKTNVKFDTDIVKSTADISVDFAAGFNGSSTYNEKTGILELTITKDDSALPTSEEWSNIATITAAVPYNVAKGKSFSYRVLDGNITFNDSTITTDTFASSEVLTKITATYVISTDTIIVGENNVGRFYVDDAQGNPAIGVDVFTSDGTLIGTTSLGGYFDYEGFCSAVTNFSVYAKKDDKYSFTFTSQSLNAACNTDGKPEYVIINASEDGSTQKNIVWFSNPDVASDDAYIQYALKADYDSKGESAFTQVTGTSKMYNFLGDPVITNNYTTRICNVELSGLVQDSEYVYRVGDGSIWSEPASFSTALKNGNTNFFVFGDIQAQDTTNINNLLTAASNDGIDYDFGIQTGDSIETATMYTCWSDILKVFSNGNISDKDFIHVLGNHEYMGDDTADAAQNIYSTLSDKYYSVTYGNVYIAVINYMTNSEEDQKSALKWLEKDAAASDATWKIVTLHVPPYNTNILDSHTYYRDNLTKIAEETGIDMVFSGHDHSYSRTAPLTNGTVDKDNGVVYFITGSSGEKSYGVDPTLAKQFEIATNEFTSVYISVSATDTKLSVTAYDVKGDTKTLLDEYSKTIETECSKNGHSYVYNNGYLECSECSYTIPLGKYTGIATDKTSGLLVHFNEGQFTTNSWFMLGNDNYYFGADGLPVTGEQKVGKYTYTFADDGKLVNGAFVKIGNYYYYFIADIAQRGWHEIDGNWYYFDRQRADSNGYKMNTGVFTIKNSDDEENLTFTADSTGKLIKGAWSATSGGVSYVWANNERFTGWQYIDGAIYYLDPTTTYRAVDNRTIDGKEYTFAANGKLQMVSDSVKIDNLYYSFDANGNLMTNHIKDHPYNPVIDEAVAATYDSTGLTAGEHCGTCGDVIIAQTETPKLEKPADPETTTAASETTTAAPETTTAAPETTTAASETTTAASETTTAASETTTADSETTTVASETTTAASETTTVEPISEEPSSEEPSSEEPDFRLLLGDLNRDKFITAADARIALRISAGLVEFDNTMLMYADVIADGEIKANDARKILRVSAGIDKFDEDAWVKLYK